MASSASLFTDPLFLVHVVGFGVAAVGCFASVRRAREVDDPDTRRGLVSLLVTSGGWASAHVLFLVVPTAPLKTGFYVVGLILGLAAVGPWLYFCSAYTGRSLHRNPTFRRVAVGVFFAVVLVKVTNPLHHLYFTAEMTTVPFRHLAVHHGLAHFLVMGLSYALATVGYFMLLELVIDVGAGGRGFGVLVAVTGLPLLLNVVGFATPYLLEITYEPLGVAVFAVAVCFVYLDRFQTIRRTTSRDDPVLVLSEENRLREYNTAAHELFPEKVTRAALGEELADVVPDVANTLQADSSVFAYEAGDEVRYYQVAANPFGSGETHLGRLVILSDVTHRERYRRQLERQNERLDRFASMVSHDLRNPLNVAQGRLQLAREERDSEHLETVDDALTRMEAMIEDLLTLARKGQTIEETESVRLSSLAEESWETVETPEATLSIDGDLAFQAAPSRVREVFENLFRNAVEHGAPDVTVRVGPLADGAGFYVADDGPGIPEDARDRVFESGYSTAENGTGFGLAIVEEVVDAHGWQIDVTESVAGGARFEITGVTIDGSDA